MYTILLTVHSLFRWIVLLTLILSIYRAAIGYFRNSSFSGSDNLLRHWTATAAHIQLVVGVILYIKSPVTRFYWHGQAASFDHTFFAVIHIMLMVVSVVILTVGSALAKRKHGSKEKYKTMLTWFLLALLIIMIAIPWPFSPLSNRPYYR